MREDRQNTDSQQPQLSWENAKMAKREWSRGESNPRPLECDSSALPAELRPHRMRHDGAGRRGQAIPRRPRESNRRAREWSALHRRRPHVDDRVTVGRQGCATLPLPPALAAALPSADLLHRRHLEPATDLLRQAFGPEQVRCARCFATRLIGHRERPRAQQSAHHHHRQQGAHGDGRSTRRAGR